MEAKLIFFFKYRLPVSPIRGIVDSPYHRYREFSFKKFNIRGDIRIQKMTPRIGDNGKSFFEYEYLREFEAKTGTARKLV
jgi:hypothetical protein